MTHSIDSKQNEFAVEQEDIDNCKYYYRPIVDKNNQIYRKIKRLLCHHEHLFEYHCEYKIEFCPKCGKLGKKVSNNE